MQNATPAQCERGPNDYQPASAIEGAVAAAVGFDAVVLGMDGEHTHGGDLHALRVLRGQG